MDMSPLLLSSFTSWICIIKYTDPRKNPAERVPKMLSVANKLFSREAATKKVADPVAQLVNKAIIPEDFNLVFLWEYKMEARVPKK